MTVGLQAPDLATALSHVEVKGNERFEIRDQLGWYAQHLAANSRDRIVDNPTSALRDARRYSIVLSTMSELERNANPALAMEALVRGYAGSSKPTPRAASCGGFAGTSELSDGCNERFTIDRNAQSNLALRHATGRLAGGRSLA